MCKYALPMVLSSNFENVVSFHPGMGKWIFQMSFLRTPYWRNPTVTVGKSERSCTNLHV